ncbi:MAG: hypothetical protein KDD51_01890 [Bdellovibrionales bacterium]|nr:hypothetical protein [Bdellovibrionales bacterium]
MKKTILISLAALTVSSPGVADAKTISAKDLKLDCEGKYKVLSAVPYHKPPIGRAPGRSGTHESVEVLSLRGSGCTELDPYYGVSVQEGDRLPFGQSIYEGSLAEAKMLAAQRLGNVYSFSAEQHFSYQTKSGILPFFPKVHRETVSVLGLSGTLNAKKKYGSYSAEELSEDEKASLLNEAYAAINYGKKYQNTSAFGDDFLDFILSVKFEETPLALEYIEDLVLLFENTSRYTSSFVSLHPGTLIAKKLNALLNAYGRSKFSSKMQILKQHPLLFEDQIVGWAFLEKGKTAPKLTEADVVEFLSYALDQAENLAKVPQVLEARYLLQQYKEAGKTILAYSSKQSPATYKNPEYFIVNAEAEALIASLLTVQ